MEAHEGILVRVRELALAWIISVLMWALLARVDWKSEKNIAGRRADK